MKPTPTIVNTVMTAAAGLLLSWSAHAATISPTPASGDQYKLESSTAALQLSSDLQFGFSLASIRVAGTDGSTYAAGQVRTVLNQVETDDVSGAFSAYGAQGGAQLRIVSGGAGGGPGQVTLSHLSVDPTARLVYGDVGDGSSTSPQRIALFTMGTLAGDLAFHGAGDYTVTAGTLRATPQGIELISQALRLNGLAGSALRDLENWGNLQASFKVSAVPEAQTLLLMALGLGGVAWATRGRPRQALQGL